jgi:nucleoside-diphosphate-sugar epimerase
MGIDNYEDREGFVLSRIIHDRPVLVPNSGESVKSFIYAGDVAKALLTLTRAGSHVDGEAFNIAIPEGITGMGFVRICSEVVGKEAKVHFVDPNHPSLQQQGFNLRDMLFPFPDSTGYLDYRKLQNHTGFVPRYSLKEAVSEFYEDMITRGDTSPRRYELEDRALALLNLKD